jgi:hypothetical protein
LSLRDSLENLARPAQPVAGGSSSTARLNSSSRTFDPLDFQQKTGDLLDLLAERVTARGR